jgi:predicted ATP-binding protein involved in virulence
MRLRKLTANNYRGFPELNVSFDERFTVIAGINGKGKTGILELIARMLSEFLPQISPAPTIPSIFERSDVSYGQDVMGGNLNLIMAGEIPISYRCSIDAYKSRWRPEILPPAVREAITKAYGPDPTTGDDAAPLGIFYTTHRAGYWRFRKFPAGLTNRQSAAYHLALTQHEVNFREVWAHFLAEITLDDERVEINSSYLGTRYIDAINKCLTVFLPGFSDIVARQRSPQLIIHKGNTPLVLGQLSDGERSLLAMVLDITRRFALANPGLDDPLQASAVVLIDELELHLHPLWQRTIVENLLCTFPNTQFIGTTHSPFVIQSLPGDQLINLDPPEVDSDYVGASIEDISESQMHVPLPQRSEKFRRKLETAREFYSLVSQTDNSNYEQIAQVKARLQEMLAPYSDDPAYVAFLEFQAGFHLKT